MQDTEIFDRVKFELNLSPEETDKILSKLQEHFSEPNYDIINK